MYRGRLIVPLIKDFEMLPKLRLGGCCCCKLGVFGVEACDDVVEVVLLVDCCDC